MRFTLFVILALIPSAALAAETPSIVVILADDLGWGGVSCNQPDQGEIKTSAIDRLATEGMRFSNAHAPHAVCTPTRYALLLRVRRKILIISFIRSFVIHAASPGQPVTYVAGSYRFPWT